MRRRRSAKTLLQVKVGGRSCARSTPRYVSKEGTVGGAHFLDGVLGVANNRRIDSMNLNYHCGLDVDAGDHGIWFGRQEDGALKLVAGETDSEMDV